MPKDTNRALRNEKARSSAAAEIVWLDRAIAAQQDLRGVLADEEIEAALRSLRERRAALMAEGSSPGSSTFISFRAQGFDLLPSLEASGASMVETLRGPINVRKWVLLGALDSFLSILKLNVDPDGTYILGLHVFLRGLPQMSFQAKTSQFSGERVVLSADVVTSPEDIAVSGRKPNVLSLDRIGVTFSAERADLISTLRIKRLEAGSHDVANGALSLPELQDIRLAMWLLTKATSDLLESTRPLHCAELSKPTLSESEIRTLDIVTAYVSKHRAGAPHREVLLSFPKGNAGLGEAKAALDALVRGGYLSNLADTLCPTTRGFLACSRAGEAAGLALRLLDYITFRAERERSRFTSYSFEELLAANVIGPEQRNFTRLVIWHFRLGEGHGDVWAVPDDIVDLRSVDDVEGLLARSQPNTAWARVVGPRKAIGRFVKRLAGPSNENAR